MNIALIGPSGTGKGTHAEALEQRFDLSMVSTGNLLREHLENRSALGLLARKYMQQGELVPDEVVDAMVEECIQKSAPTSGLLFDGFPRTLHQAKFLDDELRKSNSQLDVAIYLNASEEQIIRRLADRWVCRSCQTPFNASLNPPQRPGICDRCGGELYRRADDEPQLIQARLRTFRRTTAEVLQYYQSTGRLAVIDASNALLQVRQAVLDAIQASKQNALPLVAVDTLKSLTSSTPLPRAQTAVEALDLVLLGGPGSGKGTQADNLCRELKLPHISTGDLFRENLRNATDLGRLAKSYMDRGELVPDEVTETMVDERLARDDARRGFILDGFPRTLPQAEALEEILHGLSRKIAGVLYIHVSDEEIVSRLSGRLICRKCQNPYHLRFKPPQKPGVCDACGGELYQRDDDNPQTVRARLKTFHSQTEPLIEWYRRAGVLLEIDGEGDVTSVNQRTIAAARSLVK